MLIIYEICCFLFFMNQTQISYIDWDPSISTNGRIETLTCGTEHKLHGLMIQYVEEVVDFAFALMDKEDIYEKQSIIIQI